VLSYLEFTERVNRAYLDLEPHNLIDRDIDLLTAWEAFQMNPERFTVVDAHNPDGDPYRGILLSPGVWHHDTSHSPTLLNRPRYLVSDRQATLIGELCSNGFLFWHLQVVDHGVTTDYPLDETFNRRNASFLLNRAMHWRTGAHWILPNTPMDIMDPDGELPMLEDGHSVIFKAAYAPSVSIVRQLESDQQWSWGLYVDEKHHPLLATSTSEISSVAPLVTSLIGPVSFSSYSSLTHKGEVLHKSEEYPTSRWVTVANYTQNSDDHQLVRSHS
jgi:hypothetical protein